MRDPPPPLFVRNRHPDKDKWIKWMDQFKNEVNAFDSKSLLRKNPEGDYSSQNTVGS